MLLSESVTLPCGLELPNRLAKAAMAETMSSSHIPDEAFSKVYGNWADGGWGMIMTGTPSPNQVNMENLDWDVRC